MINIDQLAAKNYPIEYWINVYDDYEQGHNYSSREAAEHTSFLMLKGYKSKTIYRIHVRLK